jgi:hypothetical protein
MPEPSQFRHYQIVQDAAGNNVELARTADQVAVLAYDNERLEFVACHVLLRPLQHRGQFDDSCVRLRHHGHPLLARLVEYGEDEDNPFYITSNVDGETLRTYFNRQSELPLLLATRLTVRALEAAVVLMERGDLMPEDPVECLRLVQTGATDLKVIVADFRLIDSPTSSRNKNRTVKGSLDRQLKLLRSFLTEMSNSAGPTITDSQVATADFAELLSGVLMSCTPEHGSALAELKDSLLQYLPAHLDTEIPTSLKPRALIAPLLASYQEVARALVNQVRIQSQRLDMANPYSMRGTLTRTGRPVMVEQIPPFRLSGSKGLDSVKQVARLTAKRETAALLPISHFTEDEPLACLAEELPEGLNLAELLQARGRLDVQEIYLLLAALDAALSQASAARLEIKKLRLEDIYLLLGFSREDARLTRLLATPLTEWPAFTLLLRAHPTLASMAGRGTDPSALLPARLPGSRSPAWGGGWLAAVGSFLCGLYGNETPTAQPSSTSRQERDAVQRMLMDELVKGRESVHCTRPDFLARLARVIHHYDLVHPTASATPPAVGQPYTPYLQQHSAVALTDALPLEEEEEKLTAGFAELLFNGDATSAPPSGGIWGQGASHDHDSGRVRDWGLDAGEDTSLKWVKRAVFIGGSMVLGGILATLSGQALWSKKTRLLPGSPPNVKAPATPGTR